MSLCSKSLLFRSVQELVTDSPLAYVVSACFDGWFYQWELAPRSHEAEDKVGALPFLFGPWRSPLTFPPCRSLSLYLNGDETSPEKVH